MFRTQGETLPALRFPAFQDAGVWEYTTLDSLVSVARQKEELPGIAMLEDRLFVVRMLDGVSCFWMMLPLLMTRPMTFAATEIHAGDELLTMTGASGRSAVADASIAGGNVNQHVCSIRLNTNELDAAFLNQYFLSPYGQKQIDRFQVGGDRDSLTATHVRSLSLFSKIEEAGQSRRLSSIHRRAHCCATSEAGCTHY